MKLLNLAIASIVDANTGNGINQQFVNQFGSGTTDYAQHGREIRANSVLALIAKIKASIKQYIEDSKASARARENTREILHLNDHMLKDIGLTYNDVVDLRMGLISTDELGQRRGQNRNDQDASLDRLSQQLVSVSETNLESANQENYELKKCA